LIWIKIIKDYNSAILGRAETETYNEAIIKSRSLVIGAGLLRESLSVFPEIGGAFEIGLKY
jgi:hypothetical protein